MVGSVYQMASIEMINEEEKRGQFAPIKLIPLQVADKGSW